MCVFSIRLMSHVPGEIKQKTLLLLQRICDAPAMTEPQASATPPMLQPDEAFVFPRKQEKACAHDRMFRASKNKNSPTLFFRQQKLTRKYAR